MENNTKSLSPFEKDLVKKFLQDRMSVKIFFNLIDEDGNMFFTDAESFADDKFFFELSAETESLCGKIVRAEFYFSKIGLCFTSKVSVTDSREFFVLDFSGDVFRKESSESASSDFFGGLSFSDGRKRTVNLFFRGHEDYNLFSEPKWDDIAEDIRNDAKEFLSFLIEQSKKNNISVGSGKHLIPVCRYLMQNFNEEIEAVQGRVKPFYCLYVDSKRIVLAKRHDSFLPALEMDYKISMIFLLSGNRLLRRTVKASCIPENYYFSDDGESVCCVCRLRNLQLEDMRFLSEKK